MKTRAMRWITVATGVTTGLLGVGLAAEMSQAAEPEAVKPEEIKPEIPEQNTTEQAPALISALPPIDNPTEPPLTSEPVSQSAADLAMPQVLSQPPKSPILGDFESEIVQKASQNGEIDTKPHLNPNPQKDETNLNALKVPLFKGDLGGSNHDLQLTQSSPYKPAQNPPLAQTPVVAQNSAAIQTWAAQIPAPEPAPAVPDSPPGLEDSMAQVTSVSQLSDVQPTDWAYQALQSLTERYGVIQGYPDGLFRGSRSLTRFEFAAGLNAALDRVTELVASSSQDAATQADLEILSRLQDDFKTELVTLRARVDGLDARVAEVAANQFSTTVVLNGQTTFGLANAWGGNPPGQGNGNTVFAYLTQLQLSGSFSRHDSFRIDLESGNFDGGGFAKPEALNTQMALLGFQSDTNNGLELSGAEYRVAIGDRLVLTAKPVGFSLDTVLSPNSLYTSASQGALSRFAAENPVFRIGDLDSGLGLDWLITDQARLQIAYGARNAGDPAQGLFNSDHRAFGVQLLTRPFGAFTTGIAYVNAFSSDGFLDTFTGSTNADTSGGFREAAAIHAVSGTFQWPITPHIVLGAWGGVTITDSLPSDAVAVSSTYQFSLGFPDTFGREGDLLGVMVGQPFRLRYGLEIEREDEASGLHYEIFYRIRVNDNIAITPGIFVVTDPGHIANNNTIIVGAIRSSFEF